MEEGSSDPSSYHSLLKGANVDYLSQNDRRSNLIYYFYNSVDGAKVFTTNPFLDSVQGTTIDLVAIPIVDVIKESAKSLTLTTLKDKP